MGREENAAIFEDTERLCKSNHKLKESIIKSTTQQKLILHGNTISKVEKNVYTEQAPNLRPCPSNTYNSGDGNIAVEIMDKELLALHEKRLRRILDVAVTERNEVVILGAFGCGAFLNNPKIVAQAAKNVVAEYFHAFKVIEFAVYCNPRDEENYRAVNTAP